MIRKAHLLVLASALGLLTALAWHLRTRPPSSPPLRSSTEHPLVFPEESRIEEPVPRDKRKIKCVVRNRVSGEPIRGAIINTDAGWSGKTDDLGELTGEVAAGRDAIRIEVALAEGQPPALRQEPPLPTYDGTEYVLPISIDGVIRLSGTVVDFDAGKPLSDFSLEIYGIGRGKDPVTHIEFKSGAEGRFSLPVPYCRSMKLDILAQRGYYVHESTAKIRDPEGIGEMNLQVFVRKWRSLTVEVVDENLLPIPKARVAVVNVERADGGGRTLSGRPVAGDDGRVRVVLEDGFLTISAIASGYERTTLDPFRVTRDSEFVEPLRVVLQPSRLQVRGRVIDEDGAGVSGLRVHFKVQRSEELKITPQLWRHLIDDMVTTDAEGYFLLTSASRRFLYRADSPMEDDSEFEVEEQNLEIGDSLLLLRARRRY